MGTTIMLYDKPQSTLYEMWCSVTNDLCMYWMIIRGLWGTHCDIFTPKTWTMSDTEAKMADQFCSIMEK